MSAVVRMGFQVIQLVCLARLLTPADFGVVAVTASIVAVLQIFADAGMSNAIIHFREVTSRQLSTVFWLNVIVAAVLALSLAGFSEYVALWYGKPLLLQLLRLSACTLFVNACAQQLRVGAQKELRFSALTLIELASAASAVVVTLWLAWEGWGALAMAVGAFCGACTGTALSWLFLARGWRPNLVLDVRSVKHLLSFGAFTVSNAIAVSVINQLDILLGGRMFDANSLGNYSLPKTLMLNVQSLINPIVTRVGLPIMAIAHDEPSVLKRVYLRTVQMTASINFPIYAIVFVFATEIVAVFLGQRWVAVIPILRVSALWGLVRSTGNPVGSLLAATGRADLEFKWNLGWLAVTPAVLLLGGSAAGVFGLACAATVLALMQFVPLWYILVRPTCRIGLQEYCSQLGTPLLISGVAATVGFAGSRLVSGELIRLASGVSLAAVTYAALTIRFNDTVARMVRDLARLNSSAA